MTYYVGQVLYVLPTGKTNVVPIQVVEEITKKTLEGEAVSHVVRVGQNEELTDISRVSGEIFDSVEKVKTILFERSQSALEKIVNNAVSKAKEWYPKAFEEPKKEETLIEQVTQNPEEKKQQKEKPLVKRRRTTTKQKQMAKVKMPDGTIANVDLGDS